VRHLNRRIGLLEATSANMLEMIGVGPFITIPLMLASMNGPQAMLGWLLGATVAICDGFVWAELGAAMPGTGGPYHYLSEAYGPRRLGRLMSFLFIWETICLAPLSIGSGAVGFAQYTRYLWKDMALWQEKLVAMTVCLLITALLYRDIRTVGRLSVAMWVVVIGTAGWIAVSGLLNFHARVAFDFPPGAFTPSPALFFGLGGATLIAMYDYGGYNNVCFFAGEVQRPERTIPRSIILSIAAVAVLYLTMNVTIIGVVPWREAVHSTSIVSDFMQRLYGVRTARVVTVLILWTTFASVFAVLLGYSRVPYAAAVDGRFFSAFARLHPSKDFPSFSVLFIGATSALACLLDLDALIKALIVIQVLIQFVAQVIAIPLIRRGRPDIQRPFSMPLYPWTAIVALLGWLYILVASGMVYISAGVGLLAVGVAAYLVRARQVHEWPFERPEVKHWP
jgi:amino acid transporter